MKILIMNGPNLNLLGIREPSIYGKTSLYELVKTIECHGREKGVQVDHFQSNEEGSLINALHKAVGKYDGIIFNPGAYAHYSYALRDAIASISVPVVEVHISNIHARDSFRSNSVLAGVCIGQICGLGIEGYKLALEYFQRHQEAI